MLFHVQQVYFYIKRHLHLMFNRAKIDCFLSVLLFTALRALIIKAQRHRNKHSNDTISNNNYKKKKFIVINCGFLKVMWKVSQLVFRHNV